MNDLYARVVENAKRVNEHQQAINAMPFANCTNCGASSYMAALTGICLGCEMGARVLFDLMAGSSAIDEGATP